MNISQERLVEMVLEEVSALRSGKSAGEKVRGDGGQENAVHPLPLPDFSAQAKLPQEEADEASPGAHSEASLAQMQEHTVARIGIGRAGARLRTESLLSFRADHAAARDAVLEDMEQAFAEKLGLFTVRSQCRNKNEYLTRPDLGRKICPESEKILLERCKKSPRVQIFAAGGLSSVSMQANLENILPALSDALKEKGIETGTPFYAHLARVGYEDAVSLLLDAELVCVLIGERPGLATAESMSAYIAYRATPGMEESRRSVISNIHRGGTNAVEAGAYIAEMMEQILKAKASGVELKR